ncbi:MAG: hypothetical protein AABW50_00790 [Nanoarchaeota archaeon]
MKIKNKKSQMKIQQTAFMLLALTLLFALVGLFFLGFKLTSVKNLASDLDEKNAKLLVSKLANSPEFSCGESFGNAKGACIDEDKVMMLKELPEYNDFWSVADIKIRKIYPKLQTLQLNQEVKCTRTNYPSCNIIELKGASVTGNYESNFVSLCRKEPQGQSFYNKCEIAELLVSYVK